MGQFQTHEKFRVPKISLIHPTRQIKIYWIQQLRLFFKSHQNVEDIVRKLLFRMAPSPIDARRQYGPLAVCFGFYCHAIAVFFYYAPPPRRGIKRWCCLTSVCLSVAYIGPKSRTERPRKTKIGTGVAHITRDSGTIFKVKGQRSRSQGAGAYCGGLPHSFFVLTSIMQITSTCIVVYWDILDLVFASYRYGF